MYLHSTPKSPVARDICAGIFSLSELLSGGYDDSMGAYRRSFLILPLSSLNRFVDYSFTCYYSLTPDTRWIGCSPRRCRLCSCPRRLSAESPNPSKPFTDWFCGLFPVSLLRSAVVCQHPFVFLFVQMTHSPPSASHP